MRLLAGCLSAVLSCATVAAGEDRPVLDVTLGLRTEGEGLRVPSGGDGENEAVVLGGVAACRVTGKGARYLYVAIDHPSYRQGSADLYVTAEVFDDTISRVTVQYDRAAACPTLETLYAAAEFSYLLVGSGRWRTLCFVLPQARLGHGQNFGADFRFAVSNAAFRRISVSSTRPAGFSADQTVDAEALGHVTVARTAGMELTYGSDANAADAALFKALSVSSVESYVDWAGVEPARDQWEWGKWDKQVEVLRAAKLKWVPFLVAGPAYATPLWFQNSADSHVCRCLEHGQDSKVQSLFNPALRPQVERFLKAFAERYRDAGIIESVLLGVTGIYGESIYPSGPEGGWTARLTGPYHNHFGWWAGDAYAVAAFRRAMADRYGRVRRLNAAWGTSYASFDEVSTFQPDRAPGDRARADFVEWYQQAMTDWVVFWMKTARRVFPKTEIYLCTGGDGTPGLGADFTAQTAAIARYGAGVRITNEGSDYAHNFSVTREVATATRHYGTFCGFEPASKVDATGIVARIYNATASGAHQLHDYSPNTLGQGTEALASFCTNAAWLTPRKPRVDAALYLPRETWALEPDAVGRTLSLSRALRDVTDLDFVTRRSLADGYLRGYRTLVLAHASALEPESAKAIERWVRKGGVLIVATRPGETVGDRLYDQAAWRSRLLANGAFTGAVFRPAFDGAAPAHWALRVGSPEDEGWLCGDWNGRENGHEWEAAIPGATMRWSGARPAVWLPVTPGRDHTVRLSVSVPGQALGASGIAVRVNGQPVGAIARPGRQDIAFAVSAAVLGTNAVARLEFEAVTWTPSASGSGDTRDLGFSVRQVEVFRAGEERTPPSEVALRMEVDREVLRPLMRAVGRGVTVLLKGLADDEKLVARVLAMQMPDGIDGRLDRRYATATEDGLVWFESGRATIWKTNAR